MTAPAPELTPEGALALARLLRVAGGVLESRVRGKSMGPSFPSGSAIRIRYGPEIGCPDGAVIAFVGSRGLVGHRVVGRGTGSHGQALVLTRGDGMIVCDPPVTPDRVLGVVEEWHDGTGWRPLPPPPRPGPLRRLGMALSLFAVRAALRVNPALANDLAEKMSGVVGRFSRAAVAPRDPRRDLLDVLRFAAPRPETTAPPGPGDIDWDRVVQAAPVEIHAYLAHRVHDRFGDRPLPEAAAQRLDTARRAAAVGYLRRQALLRRVAMVLDAAGIRFVVLKGAALAHLAYPDPALRSMGDIDIWVQGDTLDAAVRTLLEAGLRYPERLTDRTAAAVQVDRLTTRALELADSGVLVEVHGVLRSMASVGAAWEAAAWSRTVVSDLGGITARTLHPEDMLTHLAMHCAAHHRFEGGLRFLLDISLWLDRAGDRLHWPALLADWERDGCRTWAELVLVLAHGMLGAPVPEAVAQAEGRPPEFEELLQLARAQALEPAITLPPTLAWISGRPSGAGRARWMVHRLTRWYWEGPPGATRSPVQAARDAARRLRHDLRHKLPAYLRGIRDGSLRGAELRRRMALAAAREKMAALVAQAEARSRSS